MSQDALPPMQETVTVDLQPVETKQLIPVDIELLERYATLMRSLCADQTFTNEDLVALAIQHRLNALHQSNPLT